MPRDVADCDVEVVGGRREKESVEQFHDVWLLAATIFPGQDDGLVVAEEADLATPPGMAPGVHGSHDGKQLLPLDGVRLLVWLPGEVEPCSAEVRSETQCAGRVSVELHVCGLDG